MTFRVLIDVPVFEGHQQIYAVFLSSVFRARGIEVELDVGEVGGSDWEKALFTPSHELPQITESSTVCGRWAYLKRRATEFDAIFLVDADWYSNEIGVCASRDDALPAHTVGVVTRTCEWFPGEPFYFNDQALLQRSVSKIRRLVRGPGKVHAWLDAVQQGKALDVALCKDERVVAAMGAPFVWMPDIAFTGKPDEGGLLVEEQSLFSTLDGFSEGERDCILLFFGTGTWYKGYDYFLKLASDERNLVAVHIGLPELAEPGKNMHFDTPALRKSLRAEGRLLETGRFASEAASKKAFDYVRRFVSCHRLSGTSGTVIQSIMSGVPVLTPSKGLLGYRTREYGIGRTYRALDSHSLHHAWKRFVLDDMSLFRSGIDRFQIDFGADAIAAVTTVSIMRH